MRRWHERAGKRRKVGPERLAVGRRAIILGWGRVGAPPTIGPTGDILTTQSRGTLV